MIDNIDNNVFSERLEYALSNKKISPAELSRRTDISRSIISRYLSGQFKPKMDKAVKIANALNVNVAWLLGISDEINSSSLIDTILFSMNDKSEISLLNENIKINDDGSIEELNNQHRLDTLGFVRGGIPMTAVENIIDFEDVDPKQYPSGRKEYFALQITGDSMSTLIDDKDVVIVHKQETVENGEIAIVLVNGEDATCKKIAFSEDGIILISLNPKYDPMFYTKDDIESLPVTIIGKVVEIRKKL